MYYLSFFSFFAAAFLNYAYILRSRLDTFRRPLELVTLLLE